MLHLRQLTNDRVSHVPQSFKMLGHQRETNKKFKDVQPFDALASSCNLRMNLQISKGASLKVENLQSPSIGRCLNEGGQIFLGFAVFA